MQINDITQATIGAAIEVHLQLGPSRSCTNFIASAADGTEQVYTLFPKVAMWNGFMENYVIRFRS